MSDDTKITQVDAEDSETTNSDNDDPVRSKRRWRPKSSSFGGLVILATLVIGCMVVSLADVKIEGQYIG